MIYTALCGEVWKISINNIPIRLQSVNIDCCLFVNWEKIPWCLRLFYKISACNFIKCKYSSTSIDIKSCRALKITPHMSNCTQNVKTSHSTLNNAVT